MSCTQFFFVVCLFMHEWWRGCSWGRRSGTMTEWGRPAAEWHPHHVSLLLAHAHTIPHLQLYTHLAMSLNKSARLMLMPLAVKGCPTLKETLKREGVWNAIQNGDIIHESELSHSNKTKKSPDGVFCFFTNLNKLCAMWERFFFWNKRHIQQGKVSFPTTFSAL